MPDADMLLLRDLTPGERAAIEELVLPFQRALQERLRAILVAAGYGAIPGARVTADLKAFTAPKPVSEARRST